MSDGKEWYLEYEIHKNRPGLLGEVSSLLGALGINILTINGVDHERRGLLVSSQDDQQMDQVLATIKKMETIHLTKFRQPTLGDRLAVRHGRYIERDTGDRNTFRFSRDEIGLLVDFMAELFKMPDHPLLGIRGLPRVGKSESIIAASVSANKRWQFVSSTLLKQTVRTRLSEDERSRDHIFVIDGAVSQRIGSESHWELIRELMRLPVTKVIEHPDTFVRGTEFSMDIFDYIIELRSHREEEILNEASPAASDFSWPDFNS
ncbi:YmfK family protein [Sporolactobacillus laevolacticus]|uniref:YmfK family protein n=1 Tax=Sporolactobacillus laevolacticus TaxID=33018 RepID=UPI0025B61EA4|nr:YmfK family protein [Sporolactobacillus laevolacticus]MDN3953944.1 YmfK family protein [Sporolactobacillus laevolacticus]